MQSRSSWDMTYQSACSTIMCTSASVSAVANTKVYGSADPALATTDSGFLAGDLGRSEERRVGKGETGRRALGREYVMTAWAWDGRTQLLSNYDVTYDNANLTIPETP